MLFREAPQDIQNFLLWMSQRHSGWLPEDEERIYMTIDMSMTWSDTIDGQEFWENIYDSEINDVPFIDNIRTHSEEYQAWLAENPQPLQIDPSLQLSMENIHNMKELLSDQ